MYEQIKIETENAVRELVEKSKLKKGSLVVVGCSSSEILGERYRQGLVTRDRRSRSRGYTQGAERKRHISCSAVLRKHLNRALVVERAAAEKYMLDEVCVRPMPKGRRIICNRRV